MLLVIPAIEISDGKCVWCISGVEGTEQLYHELSDSPAKLGRLLRRENAKTLHITDKDSFNGKSGNREKIINIASAVDIPINLMADFKSLKSCRDYLDSGVYRILICRLLLEDPEGVAGLIEQYTQSRIAFCFIGNDHTMQINGNNIGLDDFIKRSEDAGGRRLLLREESWQPPLEPDIEYLRSLTDRTKLRISVFEGADTPEKLWKMQTLVRYGVDSVVIGRALYENSFPCQKVWRLIEAQLEPELQEKNKK